MLSYLPKYLYKIFGYDKCTDTCCHSTLLVYHQHGIIQHKLEMRMAKVGFFGL